MTTRKLVKKYKLQWDPEQIVTDDPGLADTIFEAGLELAQEIGVYSRSTERIIEFAPRRVRGRPAPDAANAGHGRG